MPFAVFDQKHVLIIGATGSGKSHAVKIMVKALIESGAKVLIIDVADEYKDLCQFFAPSLFMAIDPKLLKINFQNPPPNVEPKTWRGIVVDVQRSAMFQRDGMSNEQSIILSNLAANKVNPTFLDYHNAIQKKAYRAGSRRAAYIESLLNRSEMLMDSYIGEALICIEGHPLERLLIDRSACLRVGLISSDLVRNFYVNFILKWIETYLTFNPERRGDGLRVIIIEEAHRYTFEGLQRRSDLREPFILSLAREIRKCGVSLIFIDQLYSLLPKQITGNPETLIAFRLPNPSCAKSIGDSWNLYPEQRAALSELPKRSAVVFSSELDKPYLIQTIDFPLERVSEEYIRNKMKPALDALPYTPLPESGEAGDVALADGLDVESVTRQRIELKPRRAWNDLLRTILPERFKTLTALYEETGIDARYGRKLLAEMETLGLVETITLGFGKRGSPTTFVILKDKAAEFLGVKPDETRLPGRGSAAHVIAQNLLCRKLRERGQNALVEHAMNGKAVDVAVIATEGTIAYEIETEPNEHVAENVLRDLQAGFVRVVVVSANAKHQNENMDLVYRAIEWTLQSRVEFKLIRELL